MLNHAPIFLFCFTGGGTNIFWNIFGSHPDACLPIYETHEIFRADFRSPTWAGYRVALLSGQPRLFDRWKLAPRTPVPDHIQRFIDRTLYTRKLAILTDDDMRFKYEDEAYSQGEIENARLVTKNKNGLVFLSYMFLEMYPDAIFFGLVRHPVPVFQNHQIRRSTRTKSPAAFADWYNQIADRMIADASRLKNYYIIKFEDLLADPVAMIKQVYELGGLDVGKLRKIRFRAKPHLMADGSFGTKFPAFGHYWFDLDKIHEILDPGINRYQTDQLEAEEVKMVAELTESSRKQLGYGQGRVADLAVPRAGGHAQSYT